jgi:hypothetical protein
MQGASDHALKARPGPDPLGEVLTSLENSLQVRLIASWDLAVCHGEEIVAEVLARPEVSEFSQLPVSWGNSIVGVLERTEDTEQAQVAARVVMRPLRDDIIIESSTGILSYIRLAAEQRYHLVLVGKEIQGIVTPSDLLKLPVRIVLFTFLTHLEATMAAAIRTCCPDDSWLECLSPERRAKLDTEFSKGKETNVFADRLSYTQWGDKKTIIAKKLGKKHLGSVTKFKEDMKTLGRLRDRVMHSSNYLANAEFLSVSVWKASQWIQCLVKIARTRPDLR